MKEFSLTHEVRAGGLPNTLDYTAEPRVLIFSQRVGCGEDVLHGRVSPANLSPQTTTPGGVSG